ncbi:DUF4352 domain-containing protein [Corynebacterium sputi]|uniref:DUF4352 domain-containing protein n=1 Tax=Corynebacterium sputi TaxID=489915 RepID=UPI0012EC149E|nr:DUF4352 domain-containing protein [Corynebacterium sputi]
MTTTPRWRLLAAILTIPMLVTACASDADEPAESSAPETTTSSAAPSGTIGEPVVADGVTMTVTALTESEQLSLTAEGFEEGTMPEETVEARDGGKFFRVDTEVENTGKEPWDLTCSFSVQTELFSSDDRQYTDIGDLYRVPGNPTCGDPLNPGFSTTMSWIYEVPESFEVGYLGFADPNVAYDDLTYIDLTDATIETEDPTPPAPVDSAPEAVAPAPDNPAAVAPEAPPAANPDEFPYRSSGESQAHYGCAEGYIDDPALCGQLNDMYGEEPWSP